MATAGGVEREIYEFRMETDPAHVDLSPLVATGLPFSVELDDGDIESLAHDLARVLGLSSRVEIVRGGARAGTALDRGLRFAWWHDGEEALRRALYSVGKAVYVRADADGGWSSLRAAWRFVDAAVHSSTWRHQLASTANGTSDVDRTFLSYWFRSAQQTWTRAARWESVMGTSAASPFTPMLAMLRGGAWPLGYRDGALRVFRWTPSTEDGHAPPVASFSSEARVPRSIFLSGNLHGPVDWKAVVAGLGSHHISASFGPLPERESPLDILLGERIRSCCATIALLPDVDRDFGLPLWIHHELDYALALGHPALIVSPERPRAVLPEFEWSFGTPDDGRPITSHPAVATWLGTHFG
jgi:hypothetical protein